ncbi:MAG: fimbrial protein [Collimonas sp.]|uniref:fimbrial protein n=1 Tax=Collimonas sp. TaxID=1963772 RepID=UPI003265AFC7
MPPRVLNSYSIPAANITVNVTPALIVGSPISSWVANNTTTIVFDCPNGASIPNIGYVIPQGVSAGMNYSEAGKTFTVFQTGVAGIGYVVNVKDPWGASYLPLTTTKLETYRGTAANLGWFWQTRFIRTGPLSAGSYSYAQRLIAQFQWTGLSNPSQQGTANLWLTGATFNVITPTCSFANTNVNVPMGTISDTVFTGIGSVSPWVQFKLVSSGCPNVTTVQMKFTGTAATGNSNLFAVTGGAAGVGLNLWQASGAQAVPNSSTFINWTPQASGSSYNFSARYMQSGATVTAGAANAVVTVLISYL